MPQTAHTVPYPHRAPPTRRAAESVRHVWHRYALDTTTLRWASLQTVGEIPAARDGHSASVMDEKMYVFGGQDRNGMLSDVRVLSLGSLEWTAPRSYGDSPAPRCKPDPAHAAPPHRAPST